jgi:hypothetical protein
MKVEDKLEVSKFKLTDVIKVKTTADGGMAFSNSWHTYHERTDCLVRSQGKVYSLVLGQCTMVLLDKMKQDADWQVVSDSYDPLKLLKLIGKIILKQSDKGDLPQNNHFITLQIDGQSPNLFYSNYITEMEKVLHPMTSPIKRIPVTSQKKHIIQRHHFGDLSCIRLSQFYF